MLLQLEVTVEVRNWVLIILMLFPGLVAARKPDTSATLREAPVVWKFDTGG